MKAANPTLQRFDAGEGSWARVFRLLFALVPTPAVRAMRKAVQIGPIEELVIVGRKSGHDRRVLIVLAQVGSFWYVGHPNGHSANWVLNLIAAEPAVSRVPIMIDSSKFDVIEAGLAARMVDNKIAAFSKTHAAMRLVIRLVDR